MEGYIKLFRLILTWRWFRDPAVAHLFVYLLLRANYTDAEWRDIVIKRGQLVTSRETLIHETGLTESVVKRCIKTLKRTGEIQTMPSSQYTVITINKYNDYQGDKCINDQETSSKNPTIDQKTTTRKEYKKNKKRIDSSLRSDSLSVIAPTKAEEQIDYQAFMAFFNETMADKVISQIAKMTKARQGMLNARVKEHGKNAVAVVIRKAADSSWLNGGGGKFQATFDWIMRPNNFLKVLEGNYDDRPALTPTSPGGSSVSQVQSNNNYISYEEHRNSERQKRLDNYADAVAETLNRG